MSHLIPIVFVQKVCDLCCKEVLEAAYGHNMVLTSVLRVSKDINAYFKFSNHYTVTEYISLNIFIHKHTYALISPNEHL